MDLRLYLLPDGKALTAFDGILFTFPDNAGIKQLKTLY